MNASDADPGRPVFRQLADQIRAAIDRGEYPHGSKLPTDSELAEKLGSTRALISNALILLTSDGIVTKTRKGTVVSALDTASRSASRRQPTEPPRGVPSTQNSAPWDSPRALT
jgi:DNA-binding GntR family transcriptional regulator